MYKLLLIAGNNLKRKKNDTAVLLCLVALSVLMLYVSISVLGNNGSVLDHVYEKAAAPDFTFLTASAETEKITDIFKAQEETEAVEATPGLLVRARYSGAHTKEEEEQMFLLGGMEEERAISRIYTLDAGEKKENSIILPYYFTSYGYKAGDGFSLRLGDGVYCFEVMGFAQDPLFTTPLNISVFKCYITGGTMEKILRQEKSLAGSRSMEYKVKIKDGESSLRFEGKVSPILAAQVSDLAGKFNLGVNWEAMRGGTMTMSNIGMGILLVFAVLLIFVTLVIVRFSIRNFIEENLQNIGILQAAGYTSGQLRAAAVLETALTSAAGTALGLAAGGLAGGVVGGLQASLIGLAWPARFDMAAAAAAGLCGMGFCLLISWGITGAYRRIGVLEALRGGICTHSFRKNHLPLAKSRLPLCGSLGLKSILSQKIKNTGVFCIVALLSLSCAVGFGMYWNFGQDTELMMKLTGLELGTAQVGLSDGMEEETAKIGRLPGVVKSLRYAAGQVKLINGNVTLTANCDFWEEPEKIENETLVEGRLPQYENEIVLTTVIAKQLGVKTGDMIYLDGPVGKLDYIVAGIDQKISEMGRKAMMSFEGAGRLNGAPVRPAALYVYGEEGTTYEELAGQIKKNWPGLTLVDGRASYRNSIGVVALVMKALCALFVGVTAAVVFLIVFLLIKSQIVREKRNYGIYKALGFTTGQLAAQSVMTNLPVIAAGAVAGAVLSVFVSHPMIVACLSFCGIQKCEVTTDPLWLVVTVAGITLTALITALLACARLRNIHPVQMIVGD